MNPSQLNLTLLTYGPRYYIRFSDPRFQHLVLTTDHAIATHGTPLLVPITASITVVNEDDQDAPTTINVSAVLRHPLASRSTNISIRITASSYSRIRPRTSSARTPQMIMHIRPATIPVPAAARNNYILTSGYQDLPAPAPITIPAEPCHLVHCPEPNAHQQPPVPEHPAPPPPVCTLDHCPDPSMHTTSTDTRASEFTMFYLVHSAMNLAHRSYDAIMRATQTAVTWQLQHPTSRIDPPFYFEADHTEYYRRVISHHSITQLRSFQLLEIHNCTLPFCVLNSLILLSRVPGHTGHRPVLDTLGILLAHFINRCFTTRRNATGLLRFLAGTVNTTIPNQQTMTLPNWVAIINVVYMQALTPYASITLSPTVVPIEQAAPTLDAQLLMRPLSTEFPPG
jgi:hypothetical protein